MEKKWVSAGEFLGGGNVGRRKHTKMIIKDVKVADGKCIVSVEIRRGSNVWKKAYGFKAEALREGEFKEFNDKLKQRVLEDALKLEEDKQFEDRVLLRLESMVDQQVIID